LRRFTNRSQLAKRSSRIADDDVRDGNNMIGDERSGLDVDGAEDWI
jgi:hypothetical protein